MLSRFPCYWDQKCSIWIVCILCRVSYPESNALSCSNCIVFCTDNLTQKLYNNNLWFSFVSRLINAGILCWLNYTVGKFHEFQVVEVRQTGHTFKCYLYIHNPHHICNKQGRRKQSGLFGFGRTINFLFFKSSHFVYWHFVLLVPWV